MVQKSSRRRSRAAVVAVAAVLALLGGLFTAAVPAAAADGLGIYLSDSSDRSLPRPLEGAEVFGSTYIFTAPDTGVTRVEFFLDDPAMAGAPFRLEGKGPFDFNGTAGNNSAVAWDSSSVADGTHTVTARIRLKNGSISAYTSTFQVANTAATVVSAPATVSLTALSGGDAVSTDLSVSASDGSAVAPTVTADAAWLAGSVVTSTSTGATVRVTVDPSELPPGTRTGIVTLASDGVRPLEVPVTVDVQQVGSETYSLVVSSTADRGAPAALDGTTLDGDAFVFLTPDTGVSRVEFYLDDPLLSGQAFSTETSAPFDLNGGSVATAAAWDTRTVSDGSHSIYARVVTADGQTRVVPASFVVENDAPSVVAAPPVVAFNVLAGGTPATSSTTLSASDGSALSGVVVSESVSWLTATLDGNALQLQADPAGLGVGTYTAPVLVSASNLRAATVTVNMTVSEVVGGEAPRLRFSTVSNRAGASDLDGATLSRDAFVFLAGTGVASVTFSLDGVEGITEAVAPFDLLGGTVSDAIAWDTTAVAEGPHVISAVVRYSSGAVQTVSSSFVVDNSVPSLTLSPTSVGLTAESAGSAATAEVSVSSTDGSPIAPTFDDGAAWLTANVTAGETGRATLVLMADPTGLAAGTYQSSYTVMSEGAIQVVGSVSFTVFPVGGPDYRLDYSRGELRRDPVPLDQATVGGVIYPFVAPSTDVTRATFWLDDPSMTSQPFEVDGGTPFDFAGSTAGKRSKPWDTATVRDGSHTITTRLDTSAGPVVVTTEFTTDNDSTALGWSLSSKVLEVPQGGQLQSFDVLLDADVPVEAQLSTNAGWVGFGEDSTVVTPTNVTVLVDPSALTPGTYEVDVVASAPGTFSDTIALTVVVGDPSDCTPVACNLIKVASPYSLAWLYETGGMLDSEGRGTGFTMAVPKADGSPGYDRSKLHLEPSTGTMTIDTTSGGFPDGNQENAVGVGFDGTAFATTLTGRLVGVPENATGKYEQGGIWFGYEQDNMLRFSIQSVSGGGWRLEHSVTVEGVVVYKKTRAVTPIDGPVTFNFVLDPTNRKVTSVYTLGTGVLQTLGTSVIPGEFFSFDAAGIDPEINTRSFAGLYASDRNGPANSFTFSDFAVTTEPPSSSDGEFAFDRVSYGTSFPTSLEFGPDGKLYSTDVFGRIRRFTIGADHQVLQEEVFNPIGNRMMLGLAVDPDSTPDDVALYVAYSSSVTALGEIDSGKVSRVSGPNLDVVEEVITGLPRSEANHGPNDIDFGPDGRLYINVGGNTGAGAGNTAQTEFGERGEQPLAAAVVVADVKDPQFDGTCQNVADMYGPNPCDVTVYASGLRNSYDQVWTEAGHLFASDNGLGVVGTYPPTTEPPCDGFGDVRSWKVGGDNPGAQPDSLYRVVEGAYYGHPNPSRGECVFRDGSYQGVAAPDNFTPPTYDLGLNASANGLIEYTADAFCGLLKNDLLVVNYSLGDNLVRLRMSDDGTQVLGSEILAAGMAGPLAMAQGPDGAIWVGEADGDKLTAFVPKETGCWSEAAPSPDELLDPGSAVIDDVLYVVGGKNNSGHRNDLLAYDGSSDTWSRGPDMPGPGLENPSVVAVDGRLYVFGGSTAPFSGTVSSAYVFDPATSTWASLAPMPTARGGAAAAVVGDDVYVIAGMGNNGASLDVVEVFDTASGTWSTGPSLPEVRDNPSAAAVDGAVYVFGGRVRTATSTSVERTQSVFALPLGAQAWSVSTDMPTPRRTTASVVLGGDVYVIGGEGVPGAVAFPDVEVFDPQTQAWGRVRGMPLGKHGVAIGVLEGRIHVVGGALTSGFGTSTDNFVLAPPD